MRFGLSEIVVVKVGVGTRREEVAPAGKGVEVLVFPCFEEEDFLAPFCIDLETKEGGIEKCAGRLEK